MQYRLLACDMDGTLLDNDRRISPRNRQAITDWVASGRLFCFASGRGIGTILPYCQEVGLTGPVVSSNGAYVTGNDGEDLHHFCLDGAVRDELVAFATDNGLHTNVYVRGDIYFSQAGEWADLYTRRTGCTPTVCSLTEMGQLEPTKMLFVDEPDTISRHLPGLRKAMEKHGVSVVVSEPNYVEFLPPGITKGAGLQALCAKLAIERENVVAIGDWLNDLEMVEWAGLGVAVANAAPEVLAVAQRTVASNIDDGVASLIVELLSSDIG